MMRVISSPSSSTTGFSTLILSMGRKPFLGGVCAATGAEAAIAFDWDQAKRAVEKAQSRARAMTGAAGSLVLRPPASSIFRRCRPASRPNRTASKPVAPMAARTEPPNSSPPPNASWSAPYTGQSPAPNRSPKRHDRIEDCVTFPRNP